MKEKPHLGVTLVIAPQWMFLATIANPYHREQHLGIEGKDLEGGVPVYLDGFAYSGILNIQTIVQQWPATAGLGHQEHTIFGSLETQANEE